MSKITLTNRYQDLKTKIAKGKNLTEQQRGYQLEKLLYDLFEYENLEPIPPYKNMGEQIDGSFECQNRFFILEAKWETKPLPASKIFGLQGRLQGKLIGTLGIFISMSDFSIKALPHIEKKNVILFTQKDMDYCFDPNYSFSEILYVKLRQAAKQGIILFDIEDYFKRKKVLKNDKAST